MGVKRMNIDTSGSLTTLVPAEEERQMWIKERNGKPIEYRYGPDWVGMQLFMEGGYSTREEAVEAWERECKK